MKAIEKFTFGFLVVVASCDPRSDSRIQSDGNLPDSVRLIKALDQAEQIANLNINVENFKDTFHTFSDSSFTLTTTLAIDSFFKGKCLIIHRETPAAVYTDVYLKKENKLKRVLALDKWAMTHIKDTIYDVNGDGREDFLVNWYGASGCCLKNFYDVYLFNEDGTFSEKFKFINPTFSPTEGIIRGVCYGHPGETELYKYSWTELGVDTVEYVYPDEVNKGQYISSRYKPWDKRSKESEIVRLKHIPKEYEGIYGYDWFTGLLN